MKTSEFIEKVEALGFKVDDNRCFLNVLMVHNNEVLLSIRKDEVLGLNTRHFRFYKLLTPQKRRLFSLAVEYASTPVDEREEEKKYYIKLKGASGEFKYVNLNTNYSPYEIQMNNNKKDEKIISQFTRNEIRKFGLQKFADSELFELVEVEG